MITAAQLRAARGLLDWTRTELAKAANISPETVKNIEHGTFRPQETTAEAIMRAFAVHGVQFTDNEGVKKVANSIMVLDGYEGFKSFMDDIYKIAQMPYSLDGKKPICVCNVDNNLFKKHLKDYTPIHIERMEKIDGLKIRALATKKDLSHISSAKYITSRYIAERKPLPFYVYGDKFAIINFETENPPRIIVINSSLVAASYRDQFDFMWENANPDYDK